MFEPKAPSHNRNWKAIDIYLFDNGQSYSPPRKYHLAADQLEWWPVTLNYLANAQYGLVDRIIDLYTLEGQKIKTPLELKNETAYVAVKPSEPYIEADYEKYLIRASKSREKRQSLREQSNPIASTQNPRAHVTPSDAAKIQKETSEAKSFHANGIQTPEESLLIQTILAKNPAENPNFVVVKSPGNDKRMSQNNVQILPTIKNNRDKRSSNQQFSGNKISGSLSQPVPVKKPSFKRRESIRLSDAKITPPPDIDKKNISSVRYLASRSQSPTELSIKNRTEPNKSRIQKSISNRRNSTQPVLSKVDEVIKELKKYSNEKDPKSKNVISLNKEEIITIIGDKNADSNVERNSSAIYIDVTTLRQFKDDLNMEKSKVTPKTNRDSSNKIFENEIVNGSKQDVIEAKKEQIENPGIATETSVNNPTSKIENELKQENSQVKKEKTQSREMVTNSSDDKASNVTEKVNIITANGVDMNVQDILKPTSLMVTDQYSENAPNRVGVLSVTDKYAKIQENPSEPNNPNTNSKPMNAVVTSENKIHDNHSKPSSVTTFRKSVNNGSWEPHKTDRTSINNKVLSVEKNLAKYATQNTTNKSLEFVLSTVNENQDFNPEPPSEITIENFVDVNNIIYVSSAVYRAEVEAHNGNYLSVRASALALASDKASNTDDVKMLSVNDKTENIQDNPSKFANESSDRFVKKLSTSVGREDVVNLKLSIDIWNHNSTIDSRPTVASMSHSPYISKQNESQANIPNESNLIHKPSNLTNEYNLKDDQKIVVIKYVSRHPKDEKQNSNENSKSNCNSKDFIILLPILYLDHITGCCSHCQQKKCNNDEDSQTTQKRRVSSMKFPVRRTTSCMSLLNILSQFENRENVHADALVNQSQEFSTIYKGTNPSREPSCVTRDKVSENRESISKRKSVAINEELTGKEPSYSVSTTSENTNKDQLIVIHDKESVILEKPDNKAIQTEWCNLMMEARLQEDGHYALFLPSIEKLKQYKLHTC